MTAKSGGLLARHILVVELIRSEWSTRLDHKIFAEIVERYMEAHGNARVSLRFLERATKATRPNIIAALRRLLDRQAILIVREGLGTRPTEYVSTPEQIKTPLQLAVVRSLDEADIAQRITERAVAAMTTAGCTTHEKIEALLALAMTVALADDDVGRWVELFAAAPGIMEERINGE